MLTENDFYAIIMGSLPSSYNPYLSVLNTTSSVLGTQLSADDLMLSITEEYKLHTLKSKGNKKEENTAYSNDANKGSKGGSSSKQKCECHNCGKKGQWTRDCWEKVVERRAKVLSIKQRKKKRKKLKREKAKERKQRWSQKMIVVAKRRKSPRRKKHGWR